MEGPISPHLAHLASFMLSQYSCTIVGSTDKKSSQQLQTWFYEHFLRQN